jgi:hypothetical protein
VARAVARLRWVVVRDASFNETADLLARRVGVIARHARSFPPARQARRDPFTRRSRAEP